MPNATAAAERDDVQLAGRLSGNAVDCLPEGALAEKLKLARAEQRAATGPDDPEMVAWVRRAMQGHGPAR